MRPDSSGMRTSLVTAANPQAWKQTSSRLWSLGRSDITAYVSQKNFPETSKGRQHCIGEVKSDPNRPRFSIQVKRDSQDRKPESTTIVRPSDQLCRPQLRCTRCWSSDSDRRWSSDSDRRHDRFRSGLHIPRERSYPTLPAESTALVPTRAASSRAMPTSAELVDMFSYTAAATDPVALPFDALPFYSQPCFASPPLFAGAVLSAVLPAALRAASRASRKHMCARACASACS